MSDEVFVDSGAFVAFMVSRDRQHEELRALFSRPPSRWSTSVLVVSETYSWFLHRLGEPAARRFRSFLEELSGLEILDAPKEHRAAVWQKLDALRGAKLTFVDASSLVWMKERRISIVWGTDFDLALDGAVVRPGPPL